MFTDVTVATADVEMLNVAELLAPGMVTEAGTDATLALLLDRLTVAPLRGAVPLSTTVPVTMLPPIAVVGANATDCSDTGMAVKFTLETSLDETVTF